MHIPSLVRARYKKSAEAVFGRDSTAAGRHTGDGKGTNLSIAKKPATTVSIFYRRSSIKNPKPPVLWVFFSLDFSSV
jgi:hypothetical protein